MTSCSHVTSLPPTLTTTSRKEVNSLKQNCLISQHKFNLPFSFNGGRITQKEHVYGKYNLFYVIYSAKNSVHQDYTDHIPSKLPILSYTKLSKCLRCMFIFEERMSALSLLFVYYYFCLLLYHFPANGSTVQCVS